MKLIVSSPFGDYAQGDEIKDAKLIAEILQSDQQFYVVKVASSAPKKVASSAPKNGLVDMTQGAKL